MAKVHQIIVRNTPERGLDIVNSTVGGTQIHDITPFLPSGVPSEFDDVYLTKFQYSPDSIALRFTFNDGEDRFGRELVKTHTLLIDSHYYNEKTIQYFISPLINGSMSTENHNILNTEDFEDIAISPVSSKLVELSFCKKQIKVTSISKRNSFDIIRLFGTIDRIIPPPLNPVFSFQTMSLPEIKKSYSNRSLVYFNKELRSSYTTEQLEQTDSDYSTIKALTEAASEVSRLRKLQKQFFLGVPERALRLKSHIRFGIKIISKIRENLDSYFPE